jgi:hypothetical protein
MYIITYVRHSSMEHFSYLQGVFITLKKYIQGCFLQLHGHTWYRKIMKSEPKVKMEPKCHVSCHLIDMRTKGMYFIPTSTTPCHFVDVGIKLCHFGPHMPNGHLVLTFNQILPIQATCVFNKI